MTKSAAPRITADVIKRLRDVQKHITEEPRRLKMSSFIDRGSSDDLVQDYCARNCKPHTFPACGTAACIAGWTVLLSRETPGVIRSQAKRLLGFSGGGMFPEDILFEVDEWPKKFREAYRRAKTPKTLARITCTRIDHFIKTKGAE